MHPIGRPVDYFGRERRSDHDKTGKEDDENRGPIAGVGEVIIKPAHLATRPERDETCW